MCKFFINKSEFDFMGYLPAAALFCPADWRLSMVWLCFPWRASSQPDKKGQRDVVLFAKLRKGMEKSKGAW